MTVMEEDQEPIPDPLTAPRPAYAKPVVTPLDEVRAFISRFLYASDAELDAITLWIAHTYVYNAFFVTPRLAALAETEDAGKTTILALICAFNEAAVITPNISSNALYRMIEMYHPVFCLDESDNIFGTSGVGERGRLLRGILNEGYTKLGYVIRVVGNDIKKYPCFGPAAFAGIGRLPKTMMSRSVIIRMKQYPPGTEIEEFEPDLYTGEARRIATVLQDWLSEFGPELDIRPEMPDKLIRRARQIWRPLVAVADLASEEWGKRAREAALEIVHGITATTQVSPAEELINVVADHTLPSDFLPTGELIDLLVRARRNKKVLGWATWLDGKPDTRMLAPRALAKLLKPYGIETRQKWLDNRNRRGYNASDFHLWRSDTPLADRAGAAVAEDRHTYPTGADDDNELEED